MQSGIQLTAVKLEYLTIVTKCPPCFLQTKGLPSSKKCGNLSHVAPFLKAGEYNWYQIMERLSLTSFFEQPSTIHDNNISNSLLIYVFFVFFFSGGGGAYKRSLKFGPFQQTKSSLLSHDRVLK